MNVVNEFYIGLYLQMYQIWKHQGKTIQDSGYVIKGNIIHQDNFRELYTTLHPTFYAPNFEEVEGAYWFGSVRPVQSSPVRPVQSVCDT